MFPKSDIKLLKSSTLVDPMSFKISLISSSFGPLRKRVIPVQIASIAIMKKISVSISLSIFLKFSLHKNIASLY
jgi:hypothetical protein